MTSLGLRKKAITPRMTRYKNVPKNTTWINVAEPNNINNKPISYGNNTTTQPIQWISVSFSIKISSWQIISRSHSKLNSTLTLNSYEAILRRLNATDNARLRKCNIPRSVQLVARKHGSQNAQRRMHLGIVIRKDENSFQQTAAWRWLQAPQSDIGKLLMVSTHSRTEAAANTKRCLMRHRKFQHTAARRRRLRATVWSCFNTQPRGGGCNHNLYWSGYCIECFNTQPRGGGCARSLSFARLQYPCFNTQPRGGGCSLPKKARKISVLNIVFR